MKFGLFALPTMPGAIEDGEQLRPIGRNNEKYQDMLEELRQICIAADDLGYDCFSTTEHHFHSEGFEMSVAPLMLYADLANRTKNIKFAPLALVLPSWDPVRCAEEMAVLDHLTKGRFMAGFARGYQDRWVSVLGQKYRAMGTQSDKTVTDARNRQIFNEMFDIVKAAWTEEVLSYKGDFYEVPFPYEDGIKGWPPIKWTRDRGAPGEVDSDDVIRAVCVVPKPYQQPHPPIFLAFSLSEGTITWAAEKGAIPHIAVAYPSEFTRLCKTYQAISAEHGRNFKLGENVGAARTLYIGDTYEDAYKLAEIGVGWQYVTYFGEFGMNEAFRNPGETAPKPLKFKDAQQATTRLAEHQYALIGTVDDVKRQVESLARCHADGELEWLIWQCDQGLVPLDVTLRQIELFATKIMPEFR